VAKTFALAIQEAAKLHPAAEPLIVYAALLAPEAIPLFLFSEAREQFDEPLASALAEDGLDEAVGALRAFALVDRESIPDERDSTTTTECIRLHRLVREVATIRRDGKAREKAFRALVAALAMIYPADIFDDPRTWPRARRLDALAVALVDEEVLSNGGSEQLTRSLLLRLALYRMGPLAAYDLARPLLERVLAIDERMLGPDHPNYAVALSTMGYLQSAQGDFTGARSSYERALAIRDKALGSDHPTTARV
jgi:tetratricopeptide (TPR) repeat protein